jgi:hypothetical protein
VGWVYLALVREEHVVRLDVPVGDVVFVKGEEA